MITCGYMKIRWYQHNIQGTNPATSEKKRLPRVAIEAIEKANKIALSLTVFRRLFVRF
jgi:hypothetical protein